MNMLGRASPSSWSVAWHCVAVVFILVVGLPSILIFDFEPRRLDFDDGGNANDIVVKEGFAALRSFSASSIIKDDESPIPGTAFMLRSQDHFWETGDLLSSSRHRTLEEFALGALEALSAWPALPSEIGNVEGAFMRVRDAISEVGDLLPATGCFDHGIGHSILWVFDWDPVIGAHGLYINEELKMSSLSQDELDTIGLLKLEDRGIRFSFGGPIHHDNLGQWLLLLDASAVTQEARRIMKADVKMLRGVCIITGSLEDLSKAAKQICPPTMGKETHCGRLVRGHLRWGRGSLEERVSDGSLVVCAGDPLLPIVYE